MEMETNMESTLRNTVNVWLHYEVKKAAWTSILATH
jgi:hypothetical protein